MKDNPVVYVVTSFGSVLAVFIEFGEAQRWIIAKNDDGVYDITKIQTR